MTGTELLPSGVDAMRKTIREQEPPLPSTGVGTLGLEQLTTAKRRRATAVAPLAAGE